jgi:hypothetical protein
MNWAPVQVGEELRQARLEARTAYENAVIAEHQATAVRDPAVAERHRALASKWCALEAKATRIADKLASTQETRRQWDTLMETTRRVALAADLELRRRHPYAKIDTFESSEQARLVAAAFASSAGNQVRNGLTVPGAALASGADAAGSATRQSDAALTAIPRAEPSREGPGLTPSSIAHDVPDRIQEIWKNSLKIQEEIDKLRTMPVFLDDEIIQSAAWPDLGKRHRNAKPDIAPARGIVRYRSAERASMEAEFV